MRPAANPLKELVDQTFARMQEYCSQKHGRQIQMAKATRIDPANISRWMTGAAYPPLKHFYRLLDYLDAEAPLKPQCHETKKNGLRSCQGDAAQSRCVSSSATDS